MSNFLEIKWANTHNLKNISVKIPKNKLTVITWLSWSGKSSLAFKTIYNVWQQKYLESLSSYARMFIWWVSEEALVEDIIWLSPTISIDQKTTNRNPRSTVWTITEIYDYYKLLYLHLWDRKCSVCWNEIKKDTLSWVVSDIEKYDIWTKFMLKFRIFDNEKNLTFEDIKNKVLNLWFIRYSIDSNILTINDEIEIDKNKSYNVDIIVDRLVVKDYTIEWNNDIKRLKDSINLCFELWEWKMSIDFIKANNEVESKNFSNIFICSNCWHVPAELDISSFSFNSPAWSCQHCHWLWEKAVFLEENIINPRLTIAEWAIKPWFWSTFYNELLLSVCNENKINPNTAYLNLSKKQREIILYWTWDKTYKISPDNNFSWKIYNSKYLWVINILTQKYFSWDLEDSKLSDYMETIDCPECSWHRLNKESLSVYFKGLNIWELANLSVNKALDFFKNITMTKEQQKLSKNVLKNINDRLEFLSWVWLSYMTISRKANTLSGWESQRIRLATQIWTRLEWIIYVLDEPSIWLHPRDNDMLIENLKKLRDIWNTLIVVEHDEDIMRNADHIIDIWPWAWIHGWEVVFEWTFSEIIKDKKSITWPFLSWSENVIVKRKKRAIRNHLEIFWAKENNLKNIDVKIPLENLVCVTWVSGSWKSSLVNKILATYLSNELNRASRKIWNFDKITWLEHIDKTIVVDQSPIWKTPRSNPATYTWVFTHIRDVFAMTQESEIRWYKAWRFSFNTKSWRCDHCDWDWVKKIEMHFLPPVYVKCEYCDWTRYNKETLWVTFKWKNIAEVLDMTVEEANQFFSSHPKITKVLWVLEEVWLWYIKLWQSSTTLSWWEAQRIKLATELSKRSTSKTFYILDEPTTWLHFQDTQKLLNILHTLIDKWNSVLVIEHNMDVILNSDYIIDIWPSWWDEGWNLVVSGSIEDVRKCSNSYTWIAIDKYFTNNNTLKS